MIKYNIFGKLFFGIMVMIAWFSPSYVLCASINNHYITLSNKEDPGSQHEYMDVISRISIGIKEKEINQRYMYRISIYNNIKDLLHGISDNISHFNKLYINGTCVVQNLTESEKPGSYSIYIFVDDRFNITKFINYIEQNIIEANIDYLNEPLLLISTNKEVKRYYRSIPNLIHDHDFETDQLLYTDTTYQNIILTKYEISFNNNKRKLNTLNEKSIYNNSNRKLYYETGRRLRDACGDLFTIGHSYRIDVINTNENRGININAIEDETNLNANDVEIGNTVAETPNNPIYNEAFIKFMKYLFRIILTFIIDSVVDNNGNNKGDNGENKETKK